MRANFSAFINAEKAKIQAAKDQNPNHRVSDDQIIDPIIQ